MAEINFKKLKRFLTPTSDIGVKFDPNNSDYLSIPNSENPMTVPSTGDFEFGGTFTMPTSNPSTVYGIIGKNVKGALVPSRYGIFVNNDVLTVIGETSLITVSNFISTYGGLKIDLCVRYRDSGGNSIVELCVDGVVIGSSTSASSLRPTAGTSTFLVGAYSETNGNITASRYFQGKVHSFYFGDETFKPTDRSNPIIGSEGTEATINTSHASGTAYIEDMFVQDCDAVKEFEVGDKMPAFRQNGYSLTFDASNSDAVLVNKSDYITNASDISVSIELDIVHGSDVIYFTMGAFNNSNTGLLLIRLQSNQLSVFVSGKLNVGAINPRNDISEGRRIITVDNLGIYIDGVLVDTFTEILVDIDNSTTTIGVGTGFGFFNPFYNQTIYNFDIQGETFNLEESYGTTITGSDGTIATINTSHASGEEYINATVWNKKPFALEFDSNNSEYLSLDNTKTLVNDGDYIHIKGIITQPLPLTNNPYLFRNESPLDFLRLLNNGDIRLEYNNGSASVWSNMYSSNEIDLRLEIASGGSIWRITTPQSVSSKTRVASVPFTIDTFFRGGGVFTGFELYSLEINGEQLNLTEGLGNEVEGSSGTVGTINTSHASGNERINYGVWQKGNVTDGWNPYT